MENRIKIVAIPFKELAIHKPSSSMLLFIATFVALFLANSPWSSFYDDFLLSLVVFNI